MKALFDYIVDVFDLGTAKLKKLHSRATFDPNTSLESQGMIMLFGDIDEASAERVVEFIIAHSLNPQYGHLTVVINSRGGNLGDAFAIIDAMNASSLPIHTQAMGNIASSALMIFMAGTKGHRSVHPNTSVMSHQFTGDAVGKAHELHSMARDFDLTSARMKSHYQRCCNLSASEIDQVLLPAHDVYLTVDQCLEYGLADVVVSTVT